MSDPHIDAIDDSDVVIVGAGMAGMAAAVTLADRLRVTVLAAGLPGEGGCTPWAQGGMAAAIGPDDEIDTHVADTVRVGGGLSDPETARLVTAAGPDMVSWLAHLGVAFDRDASGELLLGREAGHAARRILHTTGDRSGAEIARGLTAALRQTAVRVHAPARALELLGGRHGVAGVLARHVDGTRVAHRAPATVLATGGIGQLYARTTNPPGALGDGIALAARAGAVIADAEMVQFHPTALHVAADPLPLLSEALRGDGAELVGPDGAPILGAHPDGSLAPRDVVARAVWSRQQAGDTVGLDARALFAADPRRFPAAAAACAVHGLDPAHDPMPVTPAAHYHMGGVATDGDGRASLAGLWACGEVASTGLHGANRLASNSLLEAGVLARRVAADLVATADLDRAAAPVALRAVADVSGEAAADDSATQGHQLATIRELLWSHVGVTRSPRELDHAIDHLAAVEAAAPTDTPVARAALVARIVATSARARQETRGAHVRADHPRTDPAQAHRRGIVLDTDGRLRPAALPTAQTTTAAASAP